MREREIMLARSNRFNNKQKKGLSHLLDIAEMDSKIHLATAAGMKSQMLAETYTLSGRERELDITSCSSTLVKTEARIKNMQIARPDVGFGAGSEQKQQWQ